jgi:FkbH-like protein
VKVEAQTTPRADFALRVAATFTTDSLIAPLGFWANELGVDERIRVAPYGQVLQSLLDPTSVLNAKDRGLNVVLLRVRDWLRELPDEQAGDIEFVRTYLQETVRDFARALRAHRGQATSETVLLICPSHGALSSAESILVRQIETELAAGVSDVAGLQVINATDLHSLYAVDEDDVYDSLRDHIAHIPYRDEYLNVLATIVARQVHRRRSPVRKVVVVDCDNTLWRGVVGEVGAEGIVFDEAHLELHRTLDRLTQSGVLVCLCSKNEESDVWRVFETRADLQLPRERVVAATINWLPKSQNLRTLASRLNLGLDSFVFIDDNPVECAEVRSGCPEVLTIQWPDDPARAIQLLRHVWEFDVRSATKEDARRTDMYREEFRRQELRAETLTFEDFVNTLQLEVDFSPLTPEDLKRAAQLTLRTNQFNFTTIRRDEAEVQALVNGGRHEIRTVRVRDRFGDYGLVGLLIAERDRDWWTLDTFLLSCRVLGRGAEHRIMAQLGEMAAAAGAGTVRLRVATTKRNRPARAFLETIIPPELATADENGFECEVPADVLAAVRFEPAKTGEVIVQEDSAGSPAASGAFDATALRRREDQITRIAFELATGRDVRAALEGRPPATTATTVSSDEDIADTVHAAFASALRLPVEKIASVDQLEALGCDSLKIVEITVALSERFPSLPGTLLFEHRSVSAIIREIAALRGNASSTLATAAAPALEKASSTTHAKSTHDIAVVGLHVRTAGADSPAELWRLLSQGQRAVRPVPSDRQFFLQPLEDTRPHWAGLLDDPARFDAELFGVSPREAEFMDPQLRLFLEVAWSALEDAGCIGDNHEPNTGVFAGVMYGDYGSRANVSPAANGNAYRCWEGFSLANRLSQLLAFSGPSLAVDTACSSSGTALHLACNALSAGECNVAVVGGVNLILDPDRFASLGRLGILSERGVCEPFGADADGTVLGEGAAVIVLRPLADAIARGDRIYGVIKGTGLSTGNGTVGFTAPNPQAQAEAIRRALTRAAVDPRTVSYVETHGTGTHLGDPIEVRGLMLGYGTRDLHDPSLAMSQQTRIGSIKPNIGHLEAGAGMVGLIKVLLQMQHGMLLPSLTSPDANPQIAFAKGAFDVQTALEPWERRTITVNGESIDIPRRAGISSFGVGGANAHIVVEEPPREAVREATTDRTAHVIAVSARSEAGLKRQIEALDRCLGMQNDAALADICYTVNTGRSHMPHRFATYATDRQELLQSLQSAIAGTTTKRGARGVASANATRLKIGFLFTGQGSQYAGMGKQLYETQPVFRDALDRCTGPFGTLLDRPLLDLLFAPEGSADAELLNQTGYTQPALFAFQYALAQMWASWGITPDVVMGHSVGEIAALCVAGGVSLEDGLKLIAARGRLMQALPAGGTMTSVMADESRVLAAIAGAEELVAIAAINAPGQVVISGDGTAVAEITARLSADGIKTKSLTVSHAFHSPLMKPMLAAYEREVRHIRFSAPRIPFVSCVEGGLVQDEVTRPDYWLRQVLDPVRFATGMKVLAGERVSAYVEMGPHPVLLGMGRQCIDNDDSVTWLPSVRRDGDTWQTLLASVTSLYVQGAHVDWRGFDAPYVRQRVSVPGYDFSRKQYWLKRMPRVVGGEAARTSDETTSTGAGVYAVEWRKQPLPTNVPLSGRPFIVLADKHGLADDLVRELRAAGSHVRVVPGNTDTLQEAVANGWAALMAETSEVPRVVDFRTVDLASVAHSEAIRCTASERLNELSEIIRYLAGHAVSKPALWVVTQAAQAVERGDSVNVSQALAWGFGRTASLEHPEFWGGLIDVDAQSPSMSALVRELRATDAEDQVVLRGDARFVPRLTRTPTTSSNAPALSGDGTYLVTGGLGALGLRTAEWLVQRGARHVVLTGRRGAADTGSHNRIEAMRAAGATVGIVAADVSCASDVDALLQRIDKSGLRLRGVVHAAGIDRVTPIRALSAAEIDATIAAKMMGAALLDERTRSRPLDLFLCFSSVSAILGSQGRAHYAAANAYLDALVDERRRRGLAGTSINWGPWKGGGMASDSHLEQFERVGNRGLDPTDAFTMLDRVVASNVARATVVDIDWPKFSSIYAARRGRPFIATLGEQAPAQAAASPESARADGPEWIRELSAVAADDRLTRLRSLLRQEIADTLGFDDVESVPLDRNFYELGMDSLMMADLVSRMKKRTGVSCTDLVFNQPNVAALAPALLPRLDVNTARVVPAPLPAAAAEAEAPPVAPPDAMDEAAIVAFQAQMFPDRQTDLIAPRWRWMFVESAARLKVEPRVWVHRDGGQIVGHMGSIPVRLKVGDEELPTGWLVDSMVLPEYRSRAVGSRLLVEAHEEQPFSLSLGQTAEVRQILFRLGWKQIAPLQISQLLVRPENVLRGKLPGPAAWVAAMGLRATTAVRDGLGTRSRLSARPVERFDAKHDDVWANAKQHLPVAVVRDASYLNWKYVDQPGQTFLRLEIGDEQGLHGVAVWLFREPDGIYRYRRALLVDIVAPFGNAEVLQQVLRSACEAAGDAGADALLCHHIDARLTAALRACGFHARQPERYLLVDPGGLSKAAQAQVLSPANWFVTQGDSDIDRP